MFVEWLLEAYYLRMFMQLSNIPHYTTLQKFAARVSGTILEKIKIISSFVVLFSNIRRLFIGIKIHQDSNYLSNASQYYTDKVNLHKKKYLKLSTGVEGTISDSMFYQDKERLQQDMIRKISDHL